MERNTSTCTCTAIVYVFDRHIGNIGIYMRNIRYIGEELVHVGNGHHAHSLGRGYLGMETGQRFKYITRIGPTTTLSMNNLC